MAKSKASKKTKTAKRSAKGSKRSLKTSKRAAKAARGAKKAARRPARKAAQKVAPRKLAKKASKKAAKRAPNKAAKRAAKKAPKGTAVKAVKSPRKAAPRKTASKSPAALEARRTAAARTAAVTRRKPNLERERRTVREEEMVPSPPSSLDLDRSPSAARTGRAEYEQRLRLHTSTGPALTGGDVDADWEDAETVGDEAPGGDNPTPDQDIVDEIGKAIGIEYEDDQELQGGDELAERDRHRWELDPASKDDFEEE